MGKYKLMIIFIITYCVCKTYYEARSRSTENQMEIPVTPASPPPPSTYLTIRKCLKNKCFTLTFSILNSSSIDIKKYDGIYRPRGYSISSVVFLKAHVRLYKNGEGDEATCRNQPVINLSRDKS